MAEASRSNIRTKDKRNALSIILLSIGHCSQFQTDELYTFVSTFVKLEWQHMTLWV